MKATNFTENERSYLRTVALVYVILVGFVPGLATFVSSYKTSEEIELSTEQPPVPLWPADAQNHTQHRRYHRHPAHGGAGGGGQRMSYIYYVRSCPRAYDVVHERMQYFISEDPSQAAGILHLFFHDCFLQGCDASILLDRPEGSEQKNAAAGVGSLRATSFRIINEIKASLEAACPGVVSCADTLALAARDAVFMVGGPWVPIMTGRKDSTDMAAISTQTLTASIPSPTLGFLGLKRTFTSRGLTVKDLVALSGAHTIGQTHCKSAVSQLVPDVSKDLSPAFGANLSQVCLSDRTHPASAAALRSHLTVHLDGLTPNTFDNAFFNNVLMKQAVFHSDAALLDDEEARSHVHSFALNKAQFFQQFRLSFSKMSQIGVLTNAEGEVRMRCTIPN